MTWSSFIEDKQISITTYCNKQLQLTNQMNVMKMQKITVLIQYYQSNTANYT